MSNDATNTSDNVRQGGCLCGAVRYSVQWPPVMVATCHCVHCQKQAGSALSVVAFVKREQLEVKGDLSTYEDTVRPALLSIGNSAANAVRR